MFYLKLSQNLINNTNRKLNGVEMSYKFGNINESYFGQTEKDQQTLLKDISANNQRLGIQLIENITYLNNVKHLNIKMKKD